MSKKCHICNKALTKYTNKNGVTKTRSKYCSKPCSIIGRKQNSKIKAAKRWLDIKSDPVKHRATKERRNSYYQKNKATIVEKNRLTRDQKDKKNLKARIKTAERRGLKLDENNLFILKCIQCGEIYKHKNCKKESCSQECKDKWIYKKQLERDRIKHGVKLRTFKCTVCRINVKTYFKKGNHNICGKDECDKEYNSRMYAIKSGGYKDGKKRKNKMSCKYCGKEYILETRHPTKNRQKNIFCSSRCSKMLARKEGRVKDTKNNDAYIAALLGLPVSKVPKHIIETKRLLLMTHRLFHEGNRPKKIIALTKEEKLQRKRESYYRCKFRTDAVSSRKKAEMQNVITP